MKVTRILAVALLLVAVATTAHAQFTGNPKVALSWTTGSTGCPTLVSNMNWAGPMVYKLLVLGYNIPLAGIYNGHDTRVILQAGCEPLTGQKTIPDAWRFDASPGFPAGCNAGMISYSNVGINKSCPAFLGTNPLAITNYYMDDTYNGFGALDIGIRLAVAFDNWSSTSLTTKYTMFQVLFDHTYSDVGVQDPSVACGGADQGLTFTTWLTEFLENSGAYGIPTYDNGQNVVTWQGGMATGQCATAAKAATWGRVKGMYR